LSSLTAIFGGPGDKSQDSDKLLNLYWNRAELKKEFARMRKEQYKWQDRLKQQEGATARLQQKLEHLEQLLIDPAWTRNVVVFYQLRGLAFRCQRKLAKFAEQLKQQREQRQHNSLLVNWNDSRTREMKAIEQKIAAARHNIEQVEKQLQAERHRLMSMSGFLRLFRRRSVTAILDRLAAEIDAAVQQESELQQRHEEIRTRKPPENQGLDLATKRSINFMILAFAQQLFLHFSDSELAAMAREANDKSVGSINYGSPDECEQLLKRIQKRLDVMDQSSDFAAILKTRARLLAEKALFRTEGDAVPVAGTVTTVFDIDSNGDVSRSEANLLGENYWGIAKVLSR
jgi:chromosome segregation ATPase